MRAKSIEAYEQYALEFLQLRDNSRVGVRTADRWARSLKPNSIVLEIGCGGGIPVTQILVDAGLNLWAIDSSPTMVTYLGHCYLRCKPHHHPPHLIRENDNDPLTPNDVYRAQECVLSQWKI